jgi:hypothetical protein
MGPNELFPSFRKTWKKTDLPEEFISIYQTTEEEDEKKQF